MFRCGKGTTFEGGMRVPGVISLRGTLKPATAAAVFSHMDILPLSILQYCIQVTLCTLHNRACPVLRYVDGSQAESLDHVLPRGEDTCLLYYPDSPQPEVGPYAIRSRAANESSRL